MNYCHTHPVPLHKDRQEGNWSPQFSPYLRAEIQYWKKWSHVVLLGSEKCPCSYCCTWMNSDSINRAGDFSAGNEVEPSCFSPVDPFTAVVAVALNIFQRTRFLCSEKKCCWICLENILSSFGGFLSTRGGYHPIIDVGIFCWGYLLWVLCPTTLMKPVWQIQWRQLEHSALPWVIKDQIAFLEV